VAQEREGQVRGSSDPLDTTLGRRDDVVEGVAGQAPIAWLRWAGSPSHTSVAFCPPRKWRSPSSAPISVSVL
jgi:hypothetical protein